MPWRPGMSHLAYQAADDSGSHTVGSHTVWGRRVTEGEYPG